MQISQRWWLEKPRRLRLCILWILLLHKLVRWDVGSSCRAISPHKLSKIFFVIWLVSIRWQSQRNPWWVLYARLDVLLNRDKRWQVVLTWACIINMDASVVFIVILEFLIHFYLKAHRVFHSMLRLPVLINFFQALMRWILWKRKSNGCIVIILWFLQVHILLSVTIDSFDPNIVNIDSFLLKIRSQEFFVLKLMLLNWICWWPAVPRRYVCWSIWWLDLDALGPVQSDLLLLEIWLIILHFVFVIFHEVFLR